LNGGAIELLEMFERFRTVLVDIVATVDKDTSDPSAVLDGPQLVIALIAPRGMETSPGSA
jgi:hypothetical protein